MRLLLLASAVLSFSNCLAQATDSYLHNRYTLERIATTSPNSGNIPTLPGAPPKVEGDVYLNKSFNLSVFQLYDDKILEGYIAKLDLKLNEFDIVTAQGIKVLKGKQVKSFIFVDSLTHLQSNYVNTREWKIAEDEPIEGFFQILSEGELTLVKRSTVIFKKADFNAALNVGSKDHRYIKKESIYYISDKVATPMPTKKNILKLFGEREKEMNAYVVDKNLNLSKEHDLKRIFDYFNQSIK